MIWGFSFNSVDDTMVLEVGELALILELTPEQETRLSEEAARAGLDVETYAIQRILPPLPDAKQWAPGETWGSRLRAHGLLGAVEGKPRKDGRNRSEVEGFPDND